MTTGLGRGIYCGTREKHKQGPVTPHPKNYLRHASLTLTSSVEFAHPLQAENGFAEAYFLSIVNVVICRDEISPLYPFAKGFIEEYTKEKRFAQLTIMACRSSDLLIIVYNLYRVELALYMNGFKLRKHIKKNL